MNGLYYLLEANMYLAVFYGFYRLFLHKETFYTLNRYYLIGATAMSFALPLLQLGYLYNLMGFQNYSGSIQKIGIETNTPNGFNAELLMVYAYIAVAAVFLGAFLVNLGHIILRAVRNTRIRKDNVVYVELPGSATAFSFFNLLFINPEATDKNTIIRHELVHIHQKHSADVIFFEMVRILGWFNPITYLLKKEVRLLHEYIADDVTTNTIQKHEYSMFLIQNSFGTVPNQLANQIFNQSILKMRINMLNKKKSAGRARLRFLLALPVVGGMLCASTMAFTKDYATVDLYPKKYSQVSEVAQDTLKKVRISAKKSANETHSKGRPGKPGAVTNIAPPPPPAEPVAQKVKSGITERRRMTPPPPPRPVKKKNPDTPPQPPVEVKEVNQ